MGGLWEVANTYFDVDILEIKKNFLLEENMDTKKLFKRINQLLGDDIKFNESLNRILFDLYKCYDPVKYDRKIFDVFKNKAPLEKTLDIKPEKELQIDHKKMYDDFFKWRYPTQDSRKFEKMKKDKGVGGILVGTEVNIKFDKKPIKILWVTNSLPKLSSDYGRLEVYFGDYSKAVYRNVHLEDLNIIMNLFGNPSHKPEEGIGFVTIGNSGYELLDGSICMTIYLHPSIVNTSLGHSFIKVDLIPQHFESVLKNNSDVSFKELTRAREIFPDSNSILVYKSIPLDISSKGRKLQLKSAVENSDIGFQLEYSKIDSVDEYKTADFFNQLLPSLVTNVYDFDRVNEFIKLYGLISYFVKSGVPIEIPSQSIEKIITPIFLYGEQDSKIIEFRELSSEIDDFEETDKILLEELDELTKSTNDTSLILLNKKMREYYILLSN